MSYQLAATPEIVAEYLQRIRAHIPAGCVEVPDWGTCKEEEIYFFAYDPHTEYGESDLGTKLDEGEWVLIPHSCTGGDMARLHRLNAEVTWTIYIKQVAPIAQPDKKEDLTLQGKKEFIQLAAQWIIAKQNLDKAKEEEDRLRIALDRRWIYSENKGELGLGYFIEREHPKTVKVDSAAWPSVEKKIIETGFPASILMRVKFELNAKDYHAAPKHIVAMVDECLEFNTGKVQIKIIEPKVEKPKKKGRA